MTSRPLLLLISLLPLAASGCIRPAPAAQAPPAPQASTPAPLARGQLARILPPPVRCTEIANPRPQLLLARADAELERGDPGRALACADEALRLLPRAIGALHARALALVELERLEDARLAYARALAVDPDDADVLRGAAELYVHRLEGDRAAVQLGLEYALRGARLSARAQRRDPDRTAELLLVAAAAENDLGDNPQALAHADEALRLRPGDTDALYERGVALYELCRFREAEAAFLALLDRHPENAWALHSLSLVAERTGDAARADRLERRARQLAPDDFPTPVQVDAGEFDREVRRAVASLPDRERHALRDVPVEIVDVPSMDDLTAVDPPLSPSILGLYRGPPEHVACAADEGPHCRSIVFYRRNLVRFARSRPELDEQVRVTLLHELGHLHGESDDDLRARGLD